MKHRLTFVVFGLLLLVGGVRLLAALLGVTPDVPRTHFTNPSSISYTAATGSLEIFSTPDYATFTTGGPLVGFSSDPRSLTISIKLKTDGSVAGGIPGDDLVLRGKITAPGGPTYDGTGATPLLTGEILQFGFQDGGAIDLFDFRFQVTGGVMASLYVGKDVGVLVQNDAGSTFTGVFTSNFGGGAAKGTLGPIPGLCGAIGDYVWNDTNGDGIQDPGESGVNGVVVNLYDGADNLVATTTTGSHPVGGSVVNGYYQFPNQCGGDYKVVPVTPDGLVASPAGTPNPDGAVRDSNDPTVTFNLPAGGSDQTIDFGFYGCGGEIGDFVWHDLNRNGIQEKDEPGIDGVTVQLLGANGHVLKSETTAGGGRYRFTGLCDGNYAVQVLENAVLDGYTQSPEGAGTSATDSGPHPVAVTLDGDFDSDLDSDFGYMSPCTGVIGDYVWYDANQNGIQDPTEEGIDKVVLNLIDSKDAKVASTTTGVNPDKPEFDGYYQFTGVCGGVYTVEVDGATLPAQYKTPTTSAVGTDDTADSNGSPATVELDGDSDTDQSIDFGYISACSGSIGDFVWLDQNHDGTQNDGAGSGLEAVTVNLRKASDFSLLQSIGTGANGAYLFTGLCPGDYKVEVVPPAGWKESPVGTTALGHDSNPNPSPVTLLLDNSSDLTIDFGFYPGSLGDRVWYDADGDGVQDAGEAGLVDWTVKISGPNLPLGYPSEQQTGSNGIYTFGRLPAGTYQVCVTPGADYLQTYDLTPPLDNCATRVLLAGESVTDVDFGYLLMTSIGDFVWNDENKNGQQDVGEPGLAGSTVTLFSCGADGKMGGGDDVQAGASQLTTSTGAYSFTGLFPGCYFVTFTTPAGYTTTTANGGGNDATDSDAVSGITGPYWLAAGVPNLTVDAGFYYVPPVPGLAIEKTVNKTTIAPYEPVVYSYKVTNTGETTLTNIVVKDDNGTPSFAGDDFTVCTIASLAPGAFDDTTCKATVIPVVSTESVVDGVTVPAGAVIVVTNLAAGVSPCPAGSVGGCIKVTYLQDFGINDNTYGTGSIGWPVRKPHTFANLTGSDKLEFRFFDKKGNVVIDFYVDTITAANSVTVPGTGQVISYPSGYGTLGPFGGDGSMIAGNPNDIVTFSTSISENLNNPVNVPNKAALIVNSPAPTGTDANGNPTRSNWNYINNYSAVIKASAFSAGGGFLSVVVPDQHNSPNKLRGPDGMTTVAKNSTVVNTAEAVVASSGNLTATDTASVDIVVQPVQQTCSLALTATKLDKKLAQFTIANNGPTDVVLSALELIWPSANGKLLQINLSADVVYTTDINWVSGGVTLTKAQLEAQSTDLKRTLQKGTSEVLKLTFQNDVSKTLSLYSGSSFTFGACTLTLR